jgi:hypothetical protein
MKTAIHIACCIGLISACSPVSPETAVQRARKDVARRELFLACLERASNRPGYNNDEVVSACETAARRLN